MKALLTMLGATCGWFLGGIDGFLYALFALIVVDYITGMMVAIMEQKLNSKIGFKGIVKKTFIIVLVGVGNTLDMYLLEGQEPIRTAIIFFYIVNESISILENSASTGLPVPEFLKKLLQKYNKKV